MEPMTHGLELGTQFAFLHAPDGSACSSERVTVERTGVPSGSNRVNFSVIAVITARKLHMVPQRNSTWGGSPFWVLVSLRLLLT